MVNLGITTYPPQTPVTGHLRSYHGQNFVVTLEGWYWDALEWMDQNTRMKKQEVLQEVLDRLKESSLEEGLKTYIWCFMDRYDRDMTALKHTGKLPDE